MGIIGNLTRDEGPINVANLLTRQLRAVRRTAEESEAEITRVEAVNGQALIDARLDSHRNLGVYTAERWSQNMGGHRKINNLRELQNTIDILVESCSSGISM